MHRAVLLVLVVCALHAASAADKRTLVLLDEFSTKSTHSIYFNALEQDGHELEFVLAGDENVEFARYGDFQYDELVIFSPAADNFGGDLTPELVLEFIDNGGNVVVAASADASDAVREVAQGCGVELDEEGSAVLDHMSFDAALDTGDHTLVASSLYTNNAVIFGGELSGAVLFRGVGQTLDDENRFLQPLLVGNPTTYSAAVGEAIEGAYPASAGSDVVLVSALQARNNARVLVAGSLDLFSDALLRAGAANEAFAIEATKWTFAERGILRVSNVHHNRPGETEQPREYRVEDETEFHMFLEEWNGSEWVPCTQDDVQLEFVRLDPLVRTTLTHDGKGNYKALFKIPDVYGVYQYKVHYYRPGYATLLTTTQVSVRPFRHNEFERFIGAATPYYFSSFSMLATFFVFSVVFLFNKESK